MVGERAPREGKARVTTRPVKTSHTTWSGRGVFGINSGSGSAQYTQ